MHDKRRLNLPVVQKFLDDYDYQLKFVVQQAADFDEIEQILGQLRNVEATRVLIMAEGTKMRDINRRARWIVERCKAFGFSYTPRLHIQLFGNRRAT